MFRLQLMYRVSLKRLLDVCIAAIALVVLAPVMLVTALVVRVSLGSPIFFRQQRPGLRGVPFTILKFRTMRHMAGAQSDEARLAPIGRLLRSLSLDELPELLNVITGDMSLVGPRPLLVQYLDRYTPEQMRRHDVRPGITGWTQVNGRNALTWEQKFALDVWYVDHRSMRLDLRILWMTVRSVLRGEGISAPGHATMEPFRGAA